MVVTDNITILYVDDEESNLFLFKVSFESKYSIYTAISGQEGLDELEKHDDEIIVVISDMRMPGMNGVEFIKKAREKHNGRLVYFILTGYDYNQEIDEAIKNGMIHKFFTKPFDMEQIDIAITDAVKEL